MKFFSIVVIFMVPSFLTGCRSVGTQKFVVFAPKQAAKLDSASRNVVDVRCKVLTVQADYSFWENLHMLAPMPNRTKFDVNFEIERVVKGDAARPIYVHWLRNPTPAQCRVLGIPPTSSWGTGFTNGMPLRIGFSRQTDKGLEALRILIRH
jgi:hypothetical protein